VEYPAQIDCAWLATDERGALAAMITAGCGPVPEAVLSGPVEVTEIETVLLGLPKTGSAKMLVSVPRPDSFVALSERGLFVYDWTDMRRSSSEQIGVYELVSTPAAAIHADDLPDNVRAATVRLSGGASIGAMVMKVG
jgi:hypothetical protein